ncbi:MAG: hypothetical protein ACFFB5_22460 [Promethearchaeota archaeon]
MMVSSQLLFISFILFIFLLMTLLAFNIYLVSRLFFKKESAKFSTNLPHKTTIQNISRQINLHGQSMDFEKVIEACPFEAISLVTTPEKQIIISQKRCLGEACLECLRLIFLKQYKIGKD